MFALTAAQALESVAKVAVPGGAVWIWGLGRKVLQGWRASQALVLAQQETIIGAIAALKQEQEVQSGTLAKIKGEVQINGGKSLKDLALQTLRDIRLESASRDLTEARAVWRGEVRADGLVYGLYVSDEWKRITGLGAQATDSGGWLRCVASADRMRVQEEAYIADRDSQFVQLEYILVNVLDRNMRYRVIHTGTPVSSNGVLIGWIGVITVLEVLAA